jgi:hypothetical protein
MMMAVNRGIEFAKAQGGIRLAPNMTSFCLAEVVAMPLQIIESIKSKTSVELLPLPTGVHPQVISDMHWLRENILCLVSNALKYSLDGTTVTVALDLVSAEALQAQVEVDGVSDTDSIDGDAYSGTATATTTETVSATPLDSQMFLRITVMDRGIGIPDTERKKLFRPFQQVQRLAGGTGLGLFSLSKRMEALGGHRGVTPRPDGKQGSVFWFAFPYRPDTMAEYHRLNGSGSDTDGSRRGSFNSSLSRRPSGIGSMGGSRHSSATTSGVQTPCTPLPPLPTSLCWVGHGGPLKILIVDDSLSILKVTERPVVYYYYYYYYYLLFIIYYLFLP